MTKALCIIDVQKGLITEHSRHIPSLVEELQTKYENIFVFRFVNKQHSPYRELLNWHEFEDGSAQASLAFTPSPKAELLTKGLYSCLTPEFTARLSQLDITEVHLCGMDTNCCVMKTAIDLFEHGYRPVVLSTACASHSGKEFHTAALKLLEKLIGPAQITN